jgi:hypothetical protein
LQDAVIGVALAGKTASIPRRTKIIMRTSSLSPSEMAAALRGQISHYQQFGLPRELAVRAVAVANELEPPVVVWLLATFPEPVLVGVI